MDDVVHLFDLSQFGVMYQWSAAFQMDLCLPAPTVWGQIQSRKQGLEEQMEEVNVGQWVSDP